MKRCLPLMLLITLLAGAVASAQNPPRAASGPREMLRIMQIDESYLRFFRDDTPVGEETEALERILFRLPSFSQLQLDRWERKIEDVNTMTRDPDSWRFEIHAIEGRVQRLRRIEIDPGVAARVGFRSYYELVIRHNDVESLVFVRRIPQAWTPLFVNDTMRVDESVRVQGLLLKRGVLENVAGEIKPGLVFAADRLKWLPDKTNEKLGITGELALLGQLGVDVDRLRDVKHRAGIVAEDRECFYQMLAAVRYTLPSSLEELGRSEFEIARLLKQPDSASGELYTLNGLARRAIKILVPDADIRERFGIDHYYEVEVFVPLEKSVRFVDPAEPADGEGKVFHDYPFVVCVPDLPDGMEQGDDIRVPVTLSGFFVKLWAYRTEFMSGDRSRTARPRLQESPLLIGPTVLPEVKGPPGESQLGFIIATLFTGCMVGLWLLLWRTSVADHRQSQRLFRKHDPEGSLDGLADHEVGNTYDGRERHG